jgi:TolB-like protein/class 3 adenylate cyclase/Tfp pilus assembly protein PilF
LEGAPQDRVERRLAAIFAGDVAGYSRLMGQAEAGTLARLNALRRELIDPEIAEHKGRIVKTTGDGILIEFPSVVEAVSCAVAVQHGMASRNAAIPQDQRIEFRIGINLGDVIVENGDIHGDGVNVAARLEALAEPGGICVSRVVRDQVRDKLDIAFEDLGEQALKNIARPMRVFRVRPDAAVSAVSPAPALALPDKPSIAVLPFENMSGDPEQEYFADGMVEDIITGLSRIKWLFVIARNSTFVYKGRAVDVKQVGRELGVRYVLEGSVRKLGNRVRITGQLIDTANAAHVWAERYDRALDDIFALQDELTMSVVGAIEPTLRRAEIERARRKRPDSLDAYDLYLRALPFAFSAMPETADKAVPALEQAIAIEPDYAAAHALIAWCYEVRYLRAGLHDEAKRTALRHARIAIAAGGDDATALGVAAFVVGILERDYDTAFSAFGRALALSPSSALALSFSSLIRAYAGDDAIAVEQAEQALRLSPFDSLIFLPYVGLAYAHLFAGRFEEAVIAAGRAAQANPRFIIPLVLRTAALVGLGRDDEAELSARHLLELQPEFTIGSYTGSNFTSVERLEMFADALQRAGLPE